MLHNIQNSFHSAVNSFTALERKHDEIVGTINLGVKERKLWDHIRISVLLKRWLLQIEQGFFMGNKDKKHPGIKRFVKKESYPFGCMKKCLDHLQQFDRNSRESCLAGRYLQSIHFNRVEKQWRSLQKISVCLITGGTK